MEEAGKPQNEKIRLAVLEGANLLEEGEDDAFHGLTELAQEVFDVKISAFSLIYEYKQWFKSIRGLDVCEVSRDISFCNHVIALDRSLVIEDTLKDPRFHDHPFVVEAPFIRFYAGVPVRLSIGRETVDLGAFCIIDDRPRAFGAKEEKLLSLFGQQTEHLVNQHLAQQHLNDTCEKLRRTLLHVESLQREHDGE
ncbi:diguanylate cyclase with GAF sensor [Marinobacter nitratireducens]|uniref:Diguanylate cyclase with GAF sensor n=1 Tax=Marinobacter nitratireducens TaxID=1137280 RepID=A0A072MY64_9GAMM|nr:GAF domain-containing protein [Marinobacter nitratireducens]KEF30186.1 diguanylate cyclase with GAF sensor [Marinobacter nitratireducens]